VTPDYRADGVTLYRGDCLNVLPTLGAGSADSVITDCPYGLKFMGQGWDHGVPGRPFWEACLRVAKPGAYLLAFGGTRTWHRLACAVEDAGWELKDTLCWLYGQGFPKGVDVGKAIDRGAGAEREVVGYDDSRSYYDGCVRKEGPKRGEVYAQDGYTRGMRTTATVTAPATDAARLWDGWHSTLKPGWEPVLMAMKPPDGSYAHNALTHGVAGLNVGGCRVGAEGTLRKGNGIRNGKTLNCAVDGSLSTPGVTGSPAGRYPANVVLDEEAARLLDEQAGNATGAHGRSAKDYGPKPMFSGPMRHTAQAVPADRGSPSRFFTRLHYCAKASRRERGEGNTHPTVKPLALMRWLCRLTKTPTGGVVLDPFAGSGTILLAALLEGRRAVGVEVDPAYFEIARKRLSGAHGPLFAPREEPA
jgi:DNA modification methylase